MSVSPVDENEVEAKRATLDQHDSIVAQYKELIREQDAQLNQVKAELSNLQLQHTDSNSRVDELIQQVQQLKDQNALLKAQRGQSLFIYCCFVLFFCLFFGHKNTPR
ncbi:MAG: hypothetical protein JJV96_01760 [Alphaproteobacteria bacterium]|nr:hypothetical protein [Alphaproteobacteria bacterium]